MSSSLREFRCKYCNKLFFKGDLEYCTIEVKCKNCKEFNIIKGRNCKISMSFLEDKNSEETDIKNKVQECSDCEHLDVCDYHKKIKESDVRPFCKK